MGFCSCECSSQGGSLTTAIEHVKTELAAEEPRYDEHELHVEAVLHTIAEGIEPTDSFDAPAPSMTLCDDVEFANVFSNWVASVTASATSLSWASAPERDTVRSGVARRRWGFSKS